MQPYQVYVNHALRKYFAPGTEEETEAEKLNRDACEKILRGLNEKDEKILREAFSVEAERLDQAVRFCAKKCERDEKDAWKLIRTVTKEIARERKLI